MRAVPQVDGYVARQVQPFNAQKTYTCPECENQIPVGEAHVVAWPTEVGELRRHWHAHCWRVVTRRGRVA